MNKRLILSATLFSLFGAGIAYAANIKFQGAPQVTIDRATGDATVTFKETGLGVNTGITYCLGVTDGEPCPASVGSNPINVTVIYHCVTRNGNCPNAANKQSISAPVATAGTLMSSKNGAVQGSLTLQVPAATVTLSCPGGQYAAVTDVSYQGLRNLVDKTNNISVNVSPQDPSASLYTCQ